MNEEKKRVEEAFALDSRLHDFLELTKVSGIGELKLIRICGRGLKADGLTAVRTTFCAACSWEFLGYGDIRHVDEL